MLVPPSPHPRSCRWPTWPGLLLLALPLGLAAPPAAPAPEVLPSLDRATVLARAAAEIATWRQHLPAKRPRLFFTPEEWAGLRARYQQSTGLARTYFDQVLAEAGRIAERPVPAYRTPAEAMAGDPHLTPADANQELWQRPVGSDMVALSLALALQDNAAVRAKLRETVLTACRYPVWGIGHPNMDLAAGHLARGIAIAYDWHPGLWSEDEKIFIRATIRTRMEAMKGATYGGIFWSAKYNENHNQVSVAGLGLCGLAFLDEIPEAAEWTALARANFENVLRYSNADGGSDEGVSYWSYGLSYILQYLEGVKPVLGAGPLYDSPFLRHAIAMRLHAATPGLAGTLQWSDAVARDYYGPQHMLYRLAAEYRDGRGNYLAEHLPHGPGGGGDSVAFTALWFDPDLAPRAPVELDRHQPVADIVTTRSGWGAGDYLLSLKSGFTNRNHSHLDAGAITWCSGDDWLLRAPGYGEGKGDPEYWQKDGGRWTYQSNATEAETTLLINGRNQRFDFAARGTIDSYVASPGWVWTSVDLTQAYADGAQVRRDLLHQRGDYALVLDTILTPAPAVVEWLAQVPPGFKPSGSHLVLAGTAGSLAVSSLLPAGLTFVPRAATSVHRDVPARRETTYALRQQGTTTRFVTILLPGFGRAALAVRKFSGRENAHGREIIIDGPGWQDQVLVNDQPGAPVRVLAVRRADHEILSVLAIGARDFDWPGPRLDLTEPADLALQSTRAGAWVLNAGTALHFRSSAPTAWDLYQLARPNAPTAVPRTTIDLPAGRYLLLPPAAPLAPVLAWLDRPVPARNRPAP